MKIDLFEKLITTSDLAIIVIDPIAGSSSGRTTDFGSVYLGSNPSPAALRQGLRLSSVEVLSAFDHGV